MGKIIWVKILLHSEEEVRNINQSASNPIAAQYFRTSQSSLDDMICHITKHSITLSFPKSFFRGTMTMVYWLIIILFEMNQMLPYYLMTALFGH